MSEKINHYKNRYEEQLIRLSFLFVVLTFGINFIFIRISVRELPPFWGASLRYFIASAILWLIVIKAKYKFPDSRTFLYSACYGILNFAGNAGLLYWALRSTSAATVSVICAVTPLITLLLSGAAGLEKITLKGLVSGFIVIAGIFIVYYSQISGGLNPITLLAILGSCIFASLATILIKSVPGTNPVTTNAIGMSAGAQALLLLSLISNEKILLPALTSTWGALCWLILSSLVSFVLMIWVISKWKASKMSYSSVITPLVTLSAGYFMSLQHITYNFLFGGAVVLSGVLFAVNTKD